MSSFIFGGNTGQSYEDLQRKRALAEQLAKSSIGSAPKNVGEGLSAIGQALAYRALSKKGDALEGQLSTEADSMWSGLFGSGGGSTPSAQPFKTAPAESYNIDAGDPRRGTMPTGSSAMQAPEFEPGNRESFVEAIMPHAMRVSQQTGLDPRLVIAQSALETGYGKSAPGNNFFGIKSHGRGGGNRLATTEVVNGQPIQVKDSFRAYGGIGESADDYASFLQENPRYKSLLGAQGLDAQIEALAASGYATDPAYGSKVRQIALSIPIGGTSQGGPTMDKLVAALGNPMIRKDPAKMALLQAMVGRQIDNTDPMRQLQMQKAQLEIEQMQNPQPKSTDDMREYDFAVSQGFEGTFADYQQALRGAGATRVSQTTNTGESVKPLGTEGQILVADPSQPGGYRVEVAPGSKMALEQEAQAQQAAQNAQAQGQTQATRQSVVTDTTTKLRDLITRGGPFNLPETGVIGSKLTGINQEAADAAGLIDTLKGMVVFDRLEQLKAASASGASGLGQVTEREIALLGAQLGALDNNLSEGLILETLDTLDSVFGQLSPGASAFLLGETDALPTGAPPRLTGEDYSTMSDAELLERLRAQQ